MANWLSINGQFWMGAVHFIDGMTVEELATALYSISQLPAQRKTTQRRLPMM
jgi:hypothetical protein